MQPGTTVVKPNHVFSVDVDSDVYLKAVTIKRCPQLTSYLQLAFHLGSLHFFIICPRDRASVDCS
jgi:hypothetical protein